MADQIRASSVRFFLSDVKKNIPVGTGFLVSDNAVLSCAHVVADALGLPEIAPDIPKDAVLRLDFPLVAPGQVLTAHVIRWLPIRPDGRGDIALLQLDSNPTDGTEAVRLVMTENLWSHNFRAFGFPAGRDEGVWASGKMLERQAIDWV